MFAVLLAGAGIVHKYQEHAWGYRGDGKQEIRVPHDAYAQRAKSEAELAMSRAKQLDAERVCSAEWAEARAAWLIGTAEFDRHEYDKAQLTFEKASSLFWKCVERAKNRL